MADLVTRLRARLITVPKPGTEPLRLYEGEWITCQVGGEHKAGDDAGDQMLPNYSLTGVFTEARVQPHIYAVELLCEEAALEIERLRERLYSAACLLQPFDKPHADELFDEARGRPTVSGLNRQ